jgi:hypothetical protein
MTTILEARDRISSTLARRRAEGKSLEPTGYSFVLCEDFRSVMIEVDMEDEHFAFGACFDWPQGMPFDPERCEYLFHHPKETLH